MTESLTQEIVWSIFFKTNPWPDYEETTSEDRLEDCSEFSQDELVAVKCR